MNSGFLLIDKEQDWTSFDVVKKIRNILQIKKVGHIGTLDPFATGLLIILFNKATSFSRYIIDFDKEYIVKSQFDFMTDTADITGKIISQDNNPRIISKQEFELQIPNILQINKQIPPKYSAVKVNGEKAYKMAYKGKDIILPERDIDVISFDLLDYNYPYFTWKAKVAKGTYIRTLTEQIASLFNKTACTIELRRSKIADFNVDNALKISDITQETELISPDHLLYKMNHLTLTSDEEKKFINGQNFTTNHKDYSLVRVYNNNNIFIGLASINNGIFQARRVIHE